MSTCIPTFNGAYANIDTSLSFPSFNGTVSNQRLPTDPYFYANVDVKNAVVGSGYALGYDNNGTFTVLASGTVTATDFTIPNVPSYGSPFLLELRLRKGTTAPTYQPFKGYAYHASLGVTIYAAQVLDEVNGN